MRALRNDCNIMLVIDSAKFTHEHTILQGSLPIAAFKRLSDCLLSEAGHVHYQVQGGVDILSRSILRLVLNGEVVVSCQRCLMALPYKMAIDTTVTLFASEEAMDAAEKENPHIEGIIFTEKCDVMALIEDELILALPYAPMHQTCDNAPIEKNVKRNPFAILAVLKDRSAE